TLWGGVGLTLSKFSMSDDPSFSATNFVSAEDLQINVKLLPLLRKDFQIKRLILHKPVIQVIRDKEGKFNFSSLGKEKKEKPKEPEKAEREKQQKAPQALLIAVVDVSGGEVHYVDQKEGTDFRANQIDFRVKDFDLNRPFSAELAAALFSEKQNFKLQAQIGPIGSRAGFRAVPLGGKAHHRARRLCKFKLNLPVVHRPFSTDI